MKIVFVSFLIGFLFIGCTSVPVPATTVPSEQPASTPILRNNAVSSPTAIQLPYNPEVSSDDYCKPPYAVLQVSENSNLSQDEIVYELMDIWLKRYASPDAPPFCRIDGYTIDKVYDNPAGYSSALEPKGDFMRIVSFSVKLIQIPTDWMSLSGELDQENWLHTSHVVAISKISDGYRLEFAYP
jgi:hypothetical protein